MPSQTTKQKQEIIEIAQADGSLDSLYWIIEVDFRVGFGVKSAGVKVNDIVQVIPVAPCPDASEADAELLRALCERSQLGTGKKYHLALTDIEMLNARPGMDWCEWGDEHEKVDNICPECGAVHPTSYEDTWSCCGWSQAIKRSDSWFLQEGDFVFRMPSE
jgi:hypothetical protein